jgi:hypothetical protein
VLSEILVWLAGSAAGVSMVVVVLFHLACGVCFTLIARQVGAQTVYFSFVRSSVGSSNVPK